MEKSEKPPGELLTTHEVAERLNLTRRQVRILIQQNKLPGKKIGRDWVVNSEDLEIAESRPRPGRPKKKKTDDDDDSE